MLKLNQLTVQAASGTIIDQLSLEIPAGSIYALMGPNGSGKSTFAQALCGHHAYETSGQVMYQNESLLDMAPHLRAQKGLFVGFQNPVAIPGLNNLVFMQKIYNTAAKARGESELDAEDFLVLIESYAKKLGLDPSFWNRAVNDDFSGGEKKRNDLLQMMLLKPKLVILDEIDSGLDVDGLRLVASLVNEMRSSDRSFILITHYPRLLEYVKPDKVCVMQNGKLAHIGDDACIKKIEAQGYQWLSNSN